IRFARWNMMRLRISVNLTRTKKQKTGDLLLPRELQQILCTPDRAFNCLYGKCPIVNRRRNSSGMKNVMNILIRFEWQANIVLHKPDPRIGKTGEHLLA